MRSHFQSTETGDSRTRPARANFPNVCPWQLRSSARVRDGDSTSPATLPAPPSPHATPWSPPTPEREGGSGLPLADWLAPRIPAPQSARRKLAGRARTLLRGEAPVTLVGAPGRGVLELLGDNRSPVLCLADRRAVAEDAASGARMSWPGQRGLKGPAPCRRLDPLSQRAAWAA